MYQLTSDKAVTIRLEDGAFIPNDPANTAYQAYLRWTAQGNQPAPAPVPPKVVPQIVTRYQGRAALMYAGLLDQVQAYMDREDTDPLCRLAWNETQEFNRSSLLVMAVAIVLGLTSEQVDELFLKAASIVG